MGFYIEELPTEFNGITMQEADYLADEFLTETPCNRMWDAMRALRDFYETVTSEAVEVADRKTEPTISKMEQVDKDINVPNKDERQTEGVWNAGYKTGYDKGYKDAQKVKDSQDLVKDLVKAFCEDGTWLERQGVYTLTLAEAKQRAVDIIESVLAKDEPTTQTETQNSNLTFKTLEYCDICDHKGCEECIANALDEHCIPSQFKKQIEDECAKEYEELGLKELKELIKADRKDEPQTDTEIAKTIVHKMIDDAVIAEDAYPDLRQKMHDAVDEYEPQTDCAWK